MTKYLEAYLPFGAAAFAAIAIGLISVNIALMNPIPHPVSIGWQYEPIQPKLVRTISYTFEIQQEQLVPVEETTKLEPFDSAKRQRRSDIDDIIKHADAKALLAMAKVEKGKNARQLGLPTSLWCADFINYVLRKIGVPGSGSRMARSFLWSPNFVKVKQPAVGDIVVIPRGRSGVYGHVAIFGGYCNHGRGIIMVGGNQRGRKVSEDCRPTKSVLGYVRPRVLVAAGA